MQKAGTGRGNKRRDNSNAFSDRGNDPVYLARRVLGADRGIFGRLDLTINNNIMDGHAKRGNFNNNIMEVHAKQGNSRSYTVSRLKRENTALFDQVVSGKLSANKAAIMAGFRKETIVLPRNIVVRGDEGKTWAESK